MTTRPARKPEVGISSCLLGRNVRYDGGHKRDDFLTDILGGYVEWVPVCPEVEIGLGTPRPTIRLETGSKGETSLVMPSTGRDLTTAMREYASRRVRELTADALCGYVWKSRSPSCGLRGVPVHGADGKPAVRSTGAFAEILIRGCPHLPVEEEEALADPRRRENFVSHVYVCRRWKALMTAGPTLEALSDFHAAHELQLMSHSRAGNARLGRLLASVSPRRSADRLAADYLDGFTAVMRRLPTRRSHTSTLQHVSDRVAREIGGPGSEALTKVTEAYRTGSVSLIVPIDILRKLRVPWLGGQTYLWPHPEGLALLEHI